MKDAGSTARTSTSKLLLIVVGMFGFGYLMVPIYDVFCELTGLNGKTGRMAESEAASQYQVDENRLVTVQFMATNNGGLAWEFEPKVKSMKVHPGKLYAAAYKVRNSTRQDMVGQAVPSVAPSKAGSYFKKTECFCFNNQPLAAGEDKDMPLRFIIDPDLPKDISTVTLAYTFFDVTDKAVN